MSKLSSNISVTSAPQVQSFDIASDSLASFNLPMRGTSGVSTSAVGVEMEYFGAALPRNMRPGTIMAIQTLPEEREYPVMRDIVDLKGASHRTLIYGSTSRPEISVTPPPEFSGPETVLARAADSISIRGKGVTAHGTFPVELTYRSGSGDDTIGSSKAPVISVADLRKFSEATAPGKAAA